MGDVLSRTVLKVIATDYANTYVFITLQTVNRHFNVRSKFVIFLVSFWIRANQNFYILNSKLTLALSMKIQRHCNKRR